VSGEIEGFFFVFFVCVCVFSSPDTDDTALDYAGTSKDFHSYYSENVDGYGSRAKRLAAAASHHHQITNAHRILALAMARHRRLGSESPASSLSKDVLRLIFRFLIKEVLYVFGGFIKAGSYDDYNKSKRRYYRSCWSLDLSVVGSKWRRLPNLPCRLCQAAVAQDPHTGLIWVCGGMKKIPRNGKRDLKNLNFDAFVYSPKTNEWTTKQDFFVDDAARGFGHLSIQVTRNLLIATGGAHTYKHDTLPAFDMCVKLPSEIPFEDFPVRKFMKNETDAKSFVVGQFLLVLSFAPCKNLSHVAYDWVSPEDPATVSFLI
jgi:hypothetical protein